jgi:hypothetical protein
MIRGVETSGAEVSGVVAPVVRESVAVLRRVLELRAAGVPGAAGGRVTCPVIVL